MKTASMIKKKIKSKFDHVIEAQLYLKLHS